MKKLIRFLLLAVMIGVIGGVAIPSAALAVAPPPQDERLAAPSETTPPPAVAKFLTMPFEKKCADLNISEGWFYSPGERSIHGNNVHYGIDFVCPRGTPVVAMADGYAIRSYHSFDSGETYQGKSVGYGLGEFVQIWHPQQGVYTSYAHMQNTSEAIAYVETQQTAAGNWNPVGIYKPVAELMQVATPVTRGQILGYVSDTGLSWGYDETFTPVAPYHVQRPNPTTNPSWDETHSHIEVYTRLADGSAKDQRFDPFDVYGQVRPEYSPYKKMQQGTAGLWLTKNNGKPCFAEQFGKGECVLPAQQ